MTPQPPNPASYLDQGSGDFLRRLDAMRNGYYVNMTAPEKTQAWDLDQLGLQRQINDLATQLGVDVDPTVVNGPDDFAHLQLEQIRDLVYEIKPDVVHAVSEGWGKIGSDVGDATRTLDDALKKAIAGGWEGLAAGTAADSLGKFTTTSDGIGKSAALVGMKVAFAQRGSDETLRMLLPLLQQFVPTPVVQAPGMPGQQGPPPGATVVGPIVVLGDAQQAQEQRDTAQAAAVQVLQNVYAPGIRGGDEGVPVIPAVHPTANPNGPVGPVGPGLTPDPGTPNPSGGDQSPTPGDTNPNSDPDPGKNDNQSPGTQPASNTPGTGQNPLSTLGSGGPDAASTTAAGYDPGSGLSGGTSGSGLGGGSHGSGGGLSGPGSPRPGPGSAIPGGIAAAQKGLPPGMRGLGQAGTPGTPGMSPGMGGKGGKSEEDKDRQSADYLRGQHLEEWIDDGQKVLPAYGAIGENPPQEQQSANRPPASQPSSPPDRGRVPGEYR